MHIISLSLVLTAALDALIVVEPSSVRIVRVIVRMLKG